VNFESFDLMKPTLQRITISCLVASLAALVACKTPPAPSGSASEAVASVKPGINAEYLKPDLNVSNWVERFEKEGREIYDHREKIIAAVGIRPASVVADIGCGTGLFTPMLASAAGTKGKVFAVDIVPNFLRLIDDRMAQAGVQNVQTVLCTERSVELPPDSIDKAFICDVYHHFEYPQQSLASLHRALRRHGEVFLIDFKREPGVSSEWILNHVRAGQAVVTAEFEAAGFRKVEELPMLKDNYVLRFRKIGR
jgi:ubiquinone/menaquinone biosynthesis C-methylase UbiE